MLLFCSKKVHLLTALHLDLVGGQAGELGEEAVHDLHVAVQLAGRDVALICRRGRVQHGVSGAAQGTRLSAGAHRWDKNQACLLSDCWHGIS